MSQNKSQETLEPLLLYPQTQLTFAKLCAIYEKVPQAFCGECRSRSPSTSVQSNLDIQVFCSLTYTSVSTDSVSGQRRHRSACAYAQSSVVHKLPEGPFCALCIKWISMYDDNATTINIALDKRGKPGSFLTSPQNIHCGYSLEAPWWATSNEYHNI